MIAALIETIIIEALVMWIITKSPLWCKYNLYCNLVTNPLLNLFLFFITRFIGLFRTGAFTFIYISSHQFTDYYIPMLVGEIIVVLAEAKLYERLTNETKSICFKRSLITNLISVTCGLIINIIL